MLRKSLILTFLSIVFISLTSNAVLARPVNKSDFYIANIAYNQLENTFTVSYCNRNIDTYIQDIEIGVVIDTGASEIITTSNLCGTVDLLKNAINPNDAGTYTVTAILDPKAYNDTYEFNNEKTESFIFP